MIDTTFETEPYEPATYDEIVAAIEAEGGTVLSDEDEAAYGEPESEIAWEPMEVVTP